LLGVGLTVRHLGVFPFSFSLDELVLAERAVLEVCH